MAKVRDEYEIGAKDRTAAAFQSIRGSVSSVEKGFMRLQAVGLTVLGVRGLGATVRTFSTDAAKSFDDVAKSANRLGTTVEALDALTFAVELNGGSAKDLETVYKRGARQIVDAAQGIGEGKRALDSLGLSARNADGTIKDVTTVMLEVADAMPKLGSETERTAVSMQLFGRSGQQLMPMLRAGSEGMRQQIAEGRAWSIRTTENTKIGEEHVDAQLRLGRALRGTKDAIALEALPALTQLAETVAEKVITQVTGLDKEFRTFIGTLSTMSNDEFFFAALDESEALANSIAEQRREVVRLKDELRELQDSSSSSSGVLGGLFLDEVRQLSEAQALLEELERKQEELGEAVGERETKIKKQIDETIVARENHVVALDKEIDAMWEAHWAKEAMAQHRSERIRADLDDDISVGGELPDTYEISADDITPPEEVDSWTLRWEDGVERVGNMIHGRMTDELTQFLTTGKTSADLFESAWKSAIQAIAREMASKLVIKFAKSIAGPLLLGGDPTATAGGAEASVVAGGGQAPVTQVFQYSPQAFVPSQTSDVVRAARTMREVEQSAARFVVEGA